MNLTIFVFVTLLILIPSILIFNRKDDTDQSRMRKSGMYLYTDYGTGLQYLGGGNGGITPRLDINGKHMRVNQ